MCVYLYACLCTSLFSKNWIMLPCLVRYSLQNYFLVELQPNADNLWTNLGSNVFWVWVKFFLSGSKVISLKSECFPNNVVCHIQVFRFIFWQDNWVLTDNYITIPSYAVRWPSIQLIQSTWFQVYTKLLAHIFKAATQFL